MEALKPHEVITGAQTPRRGERLDVMGAPSMAAYDEIADWYEQEFLGGQPGLGRDPIGIVQTLRDFLRLGGDRCLDVGCGTGAYATVLRSLGWIPVGIDLSAKMLGYAHGRLPVVRALGERLPFPDGAFTAATAVMIHTDVPGYREALAEVARVLAPGGVFVHVGVHPCFCGGFADRSDPDAVVIQPGISAVIGPRRHGRIEECGTKWVPPIARCPSYYATSLTPVFSSRVSPRVATLRPRSSG